MRIAILKDTSKPMLGLHALHVAFRGLPNIEVVAHVDSNSENIQKKMAYTQARRHYTDFIEMLDKACLKAGAGLPASRRAWCRWASRSPARRACRTD